MSFGSAFAALLVHYYEGNVMQAFEAITTTSNYALRLPVLYSWVAGDTGQWPIIVLYEVDVRRCRLHLHHYPLGSRIVYANK
ncbi:MAG: hypothetical protein SGPRY_011079 [Prymnesium sp.]